MYRISELSKVVHITPQTIRYYEQRGILPSPARTENGYRAYTDADIERLNFIRRARQLDFSLESIAEILAFRDNYTPPCAYVLDLIKDKINEIQTRVWELEQLRDGLLVLHQAGKNISPNHCYGICQIIEADTSNQ